MATSGHATIVPAVIPARTQAAAGAIVAHERIFHRFKGIAIGGLIGPGFLGGGFFHPGLCRRAVFPARAAFFPALVAAFIATGLLLGRRRGLFLGGIAAIGAIFAGIVGIVAIAVGLFLPAVLPGAALFFLALALVGNHAEIMVGELEVIFLLDAIAVEVGVMRQLAVLFQQLRRIAARPAVNPVELLAAAATLAIVPAAAPAVVPTIVVIQGYKFLKTRGSHPA